jgi:hypothetical protein
LLANSRNRRSVVANMSRNEAMLWRDRKKSTSMWSRDPDPVLRDQWVLKFLEDRDSVSSSCINEFFVTTLMTIGDYH